MNSGLISSQEAGAIYGELARLISENFQDASIAFASGSLVYGGAKRGKSDIDINIVLGSETELTEELLGRANRFIDGYAILHHEHELVMDQRFPGEYLTMSQLSDAIAGRGIPIVDDMPHLPAKTDDSYWLNSEETWYLVWLGALAFSRLVVGDLNKFSELRRQAWCTIVLLCLPDFRNSKVTESAVLERLLVTDHPSGSFGLRSSYRDFSRREWGSAHDALMRLAESGVLRSGNGVNYEVDDAALNKWNRDLVSRHSQGFNARNLLSIESSLRVAR